MPYVSAAEALNECLVDLDQLRQEHGPSSWRQAIVGSNACRAVLLQLPPGEEPHPRHRHPHSDEVFIVLAGVGAFSIGEAPEQRAGPMTVLYAPRDVPHRIRVPGPEPLLFLSIVAPNLDTPTEAIDVER